MKQVSFNVHLKVANCHNVQQRIPAVMSQYSRKLAPRKSSLVNWCPESAEIAEKLVMTGQRLLQLPTAILAALQCGPPAYVYSGLPKKRNPRNPVTGTKSTA